MWRSQNRMKYGLIMSIQRWCINHSLRLAQTTWAVHLLKTVLSSTPTIELFKMPQTTKAESQWTDTETLTKLVALYRSNPNQVTISKICVSKLQAFKALKNSSLKCCHDQQVWIKSVHMDFLNALNRLSRTLKQIKIALNNQWIRVCHRGYPKWWIKI